jgi:hypothetical protein
MWNIPPEEHMIRHKTYLNKVLKSEIIWNIFSYHNAVKLEIKTKKTLGTITLQGNFLNS